MKLSGSYQINLSKEKVWEALNNPEILKKQYRDVKSLKKIQIQNSQLLLLIRLAPLMQVSQVI